MSQIIINNIRLKLSSWVNGTKTEDYKYFRHFYYVEGGNMAFKATYSISYTKVRSDDERRRGVLMRVLKTGVKVITGMPLLTPYVEATHDTFCNLLIEVISLDEEKIKLKYEISVGNGSFFHKKYVQSCESTGILHNLRHVDGVSISEPYITIDVNRFLDLGRNSLSSLKGIEIKDHDLILTF